MVSTVSFSSCNKSAAFLCGFLVTIAIAIAQESTPKSGADPTDFITRNEPSYEYRSLDNGAEAQFFVMRVDLALTPRLSFRLDIPYADMDLDSSGSNSCSCERFMIATVPYGNWRR